MRYLVFHSGIGLSACWTTRWLPIEQAILSLQNGLAEAPVNKSRKQIKERKNRTKKIRGVKKNAGLLSHTAACDCLFSLCQPQICLEGILKSISGMASASTVLGNACDLYRRVSYPLSSTLAMPAAGMSRRQSGTSCVRSSKACCAGQLP